MRNNNIKRLTALRKRKTSCSRITHIHRYTHTHTQFYSSFNGIDFVLVGSTDFLCTRVRYYIIIIIIIYAYTSMLNTV